MSEKIKDALRKIGGAILIIGIALPVILIFTIFVDPSMFENYAWVFFGAGVGCTTLGVIILAFSEKLKVKLPKKLVKQIADYAAPILESKGEVSLRGIATHIGADVSDVKYCIEGSPDCRGMISQGYFEDVSLRGGSLVKVTVSCPYCSTKISRDLKKCPNCGAQVKK